MTAQEVAAEVAPWVAVVAGVTTIAAAIWRARGVSRLRGVIRRDADIYSLLPEGKARDDVEAILIEETGTLRVRVLDGFQPNALQFHGILGVLLIASGAVTFALPFTGDLPNLTVARTVAWIGAGMIIMGWMYLATVGGIVFMKWTFSHMRRLWLSPESE